MLQQRQRADGDLEHGDTIRATVADYVVARRLLEGPLGRALGGALPEPIANFGTRLVDHHPGEVFTTSQAAADDLIVKSRRKASEYLASLEDARVVELVEPGRGNKPHKWRVIGSVPTGGARWLPTVEQLQGEPCPTV